jgi:hypothetical protein
MVVARTDSVGGTTAADSLNATQVCFHDFDFAASVPEGSATASWRVL